MVGRREEEKNKEKEKTKEKFILCLFCIGLSPIFINMTHISVN